MINYFLVSSPLHFFVSCNLVLQRKQDKNIIIITSKNKESGYFYFELSQNTPIFHDNFLLTPTTKISKRKTKQLISHQLQNIIHQYPPDFIFCGNDRRMEFQYAMHLAVKAKLNPIGCYMDEGMVSYLGHKSMHQLSHQYLDPLIKKLFHGFWWKPAITHGSSHWIKEVFLAFPELCHDRLKAKKIACIDNSIFNQPFFKQLSHDIVLNDNKNTLDFSQLKFILSLPHEQFYLSKKDTLKIIKNTLSRIYSTNEIAIKMHPRSQNEHFIQDIFSDCSMINKTIGMEFLLPLLDTSCCLAGDVSSTLLTGRWLRQDIQVIGLLLNTKSNHSTLIEFYRKLSIPLISPDELKTFLTS